MRACAGRLVAAWGVAAAVGFPSCGFRGRPRPSLEVAGDAHLTGTLRAFASPRNSRCTLSPPVRLPSGCGPNHLVVSPRTAFSRCLLISHLGRAARLHLLATFLSTQLALTVPALKQLSRD